MFSNKLLAIIIILAIALIFTAYFLFSTKPAFETIKVTDEQSAEKASANIKSNLGDTQKELSTVENILPG